MASADRPSAAPDDPRTIETTLVCKSCRHEFPSTSLIGSTFEAWVAWMETQSCPQCGVHYVVEHAKPRRPEEYLDPSAVQSTPAMRPHAEK